MSDFFFNISTVPLFIKAHKLALTIALIELFPAIFMLITASRLLYRRFLLQMDKVLERCSYDKKYQNNVASIIFFFADMGPNVSSFSIIAIFITSSENVFVLTIIFFVGIIIKEGSRYIKNQFYSEIARRSQ